MTFILERFRSGRNRWRQQRSRRQTKRRLRLESLELRRVLACPGALTPAITGTVYVDLSGDGQPSAGEGLSGVTLELYQDDGDGVYDPGSGDTQVGGSRTTDSEGTYCFENLSADAAYFVVQPSQSVNGNALDAHVAGPIVPGSPGLLIDAFITTQSATAVPPAPSMSTSTRVLGNEQEVLGQERDVIAVLDAGDGEVRVNVNPFGGRPTMRYNADVAVTGSGTVVWDGIDNDAGQISMGLGGRDLTLGGTQTGLALQIGAVVSGSTARIRIYQGQVTNFSDATLSIPVTSGGAAEAYEFVPFSAFVGNVSPANVDAIAFMLDANDSGGNDIELSSIGANGPKEVNLANTLPTDLAITKTDNRSTAVPGESLTYTIRVDNNGPSTVVGARITDTFPSALQDVGYSSSANGVVSGNTLDGSGNLNDTVAMSVGSSLTYMVNGTVDASATGTLANTASVAVPPGFVDTNPANNAATDVDDLQPEVDLRITKTDNRSTVRPGDPVTYSIVVANDGPSDLVGASVVDQFPTSLTGIRYTSSTSGDVTGNTPSGSGSINDLVNMAANSSIHYTADATVGSGASDTLSNTATVTAPQGVVDRVPDNNLATDDDLVVREADLSVTKTNGRSEVVPGDNVSYTIVVQNAGPSDVQGATVNDVFPDELTNVRYTSQVSGNASGSTSGIGSIDDIVDLPTGSAITYSVDAVVLPTAIGPISNTASVATPAGTTDPVPANNTARDTDVVDQAFSSISGYVYLDRNDDGVRESEDPGIEDVEVSLFGTDLLQSIVDRQTKTNADGLYRFDDLLPGMYAIEETQPAAFPDGKVTPGSGALNDPTVIDDTFSNLEIGRGQEAVNFNFGELRPSLSKRDLIASAFRDLGL